MKKILIILLICFSGYGQPITLIANSYIKQEINGKTKRVNKVAILVYSTEFCFFHIDNEIDVLLNIDYEQTIQHGYIHEGLISRERDYGIMIDKMGKSSEYGDMYQVSLPHNAGSYVVPNCKIYSGNGQVKGTVYVVNWRELEKKAKKDKILIRQKDSINKAQELNMQIQEINAIEYGRLPKNSFKLLNKKDENKVIAKLDSIASTMPKPFTCAITYSIDRNGIILFACIPSRNLHFYSEDVFSGDYTFEETQKFDKLISETLINMQLTPIELNSKKYSSHNLIEYKHK